MEGIRVAEEVQAALDQGRVVALESSIICQGMPWPQNFETATAAEERIREQGGVPATIAVIDGEIRSGLTRQELEALARRQDAVKVGMRDLPWVQLKGLTGGTTVSGTLAVADRLGIRFFATGGIGGVHPGDGLDVSSDLTALARFDVIVVCSGVKSFLDIGATLEYLETQSVPVIGYQTDEFPGFFVRSTGFRVPYRVDSPQEVVEFARFKWAQGWRGGLVVANPVPQEDAADEELVARAIEEASRRAQAQGITGQALTPFILSQVVELTGGQSLRAN